MHHLPKNKYCAHCRWAKKIKTHARRRKCGYKTIDELPKKFGEFTTGDTWLSKDKHSLGLNGEKFAAVLFDVATKFCYVEPQAMKSVAWNKKAFHNFRGTNISKKIKRFYSDNAPERVATCRELGIVHPTSIPYVSTTNAIAERGIRIIKEGTRVVLSASGVPTSMWPYAARHFCMSMNIGKSIEDKECPWFLRFKNPFLGKRIPFGCSVKYKPNSAYLLPVHGDRMIEGIFID